MPTKQEIRYVVDLGMTALLPLLMAYSLVGETAHEWLGMVMLALFIGHHCLNCAWLKHQQRELYFSSSAQASFEPLARRVVFSIQKIPLPPAGGFFNA